MIPVLLFLMRWKQENRPPAPLKKRIYEGGYDLNKYESKKPLNTKENDEERLCYEPMEPFQLFIYTGANTEHAFLHAVEHSIPHINGRVGDAILVAVQQDGSHDKKPEGMGELAAEDSIDE